MKHTSDCNWEKTTKEQCKYRETHDVCPHPEHACNCRGLQENSISILPVKQVENKQTNNPDGKGGFNDHPENINKNGRPKKGWAWSELLDDIGEEMVEGDVPDDLKGKQKKILVGKRLYMEAINGNVLAMKELFNRTEGLPRFKLEVDSKVDMKIPELIAILDKILLLPEDDAQQKNPSDKTNG